MLNKNKRLIYLISKSIHHDNPKYRICGWDLFEYIAPLLYYMDDFTLEEVKAYIGKMYD